MSSERPEPSSSPSSLYRVELSTDPVSAILPVDRPLLIDRFLSHASREGFEEKDEFHVTIIPVMDTKLNPGSREALRAVLHQRPVQPQDIHYVGGIYHIIKPKRIGLEIYPRESLIVQVYSPKILRLLGSAASLADVHIPGPFLHLTLMTRGDSSYARRGIGIDTEEEFMQMHPHPFDSRAV